MCCFTQQRKTMPKLKLLHIIIIILSCFSSFCQACNQIDQDSLLSLGFNISSPGLNWSSSTDCCLWEGIKCDANGRVSHLWLPWKGLTGTISLSIGNLTHLSHLNLSHNRLSGEFPSSLSSNYIKIIDLSSNHFQGKIPSTIFRLTQNLITFNVSNNSFTGLISWSAWVDSFCSIRLLDLSNNRFTGPVPLGLGSCSRLKTFRAGFNYLTGSLPDDIYTATSLEQLSLSFNHISGSIKNGIVNLTSLRILELYSNSLTGLIPRDIGKLTNLESLVLHNNSLSGSLPSSLKNCINLNILNLQSNFFEGDISVFNFSTFLKLRVLDLGSNLFTGSLPITLNSCKSLTAVNLARNQLEGQISPGIVALKSLSFLSLSNNSLTNITGAIRILMGCKNLKVLIIPLNFMDETMPDNDHLTSANGFKNLQVLGLAKCKLKGQVPSWIGKLKKLQVLDLSFNQLTGSVPRFLGNMSSLFHIDFSNNLISGEFPKEFCRLPALTPEQDKNKANESYLELSLFKGSNNFIGEYKKIFNFPPAIYLKNNSLSGSIPVEIGQLKLLHMLDLSHNNFSGSIPDQISQLTNLERMDLSKNHLSGEIPVSLKRLHFLSAFNVAENNLRGSIPSGGQFDTFPSSSFRGNPDLCGAIVQRSCSVQPRPIVLPDSSEELGYGLIAGAIFGFIIGCTAGILLPLQRLKFLEQLRYLVRH